MDVRTGNIYPSHGAGVEAIKARLMADGMDPDKAEQQAMARLVTGPKPTLRKLQRMIRAQSKRDKEARRGKR